MNRLVDQVPAGVKQAVKATVTPQTWARLRAVAAGQHPVQQTLRRSSVRLDRLRHERAFSHGATSVHHAGRTYAAQPARTFRSGAVLAHHLSLVADALAAHGVDFVVLDARPARRRVVLVPASQRPKALRALAAELADRPTYVAAVAGRGLGDPHLLGRGPLPARAGVVRVFQVMASADGRFLSGAELGCDIEFWQHAAPPGAAAGAARALPTALVAPRHNPWLDHLVPQEMTCATTVVDGVVRPTLAAVTGQHLFTFTEPVDVVYTWVDGSDPEWLLRKARAQDAAASRDQVMHELAANESRFTSRDELRYSLRSLEMYADWVRHIYLVTDDQVPAWLDTDNPRITVVSHRELFGDRGQLPTFNSHAIESQLHRIPGLSEHYLYLNDDVFFGRPTSPELFFHANGLAKFFLSNAKLAAGPVDTTDIPVMSAGKNNRDLMAKLFDRAVTNKFKHVPHALRRSVMEDLAATVAADVDRTAAAQFRSHEDISVSSSLGHYFGYATGRAVPASIRYFYADIAREDTAFRLQQLLERRNFDVFCLNDHDSSGVDPAVQARMLHRFLSGYFPLPSSFEKGATVRG